MDAGWTWETQKPDMLDYTAILTRQHTSALQISGDREHAN